MENKHGQGTHRTKWVQINFRTLWGIFEQFISTYVGTMSMSPLSMFSINQPLFLQKLSLYIPNPNIYLGLGLEFRTQRIRDLVIVCP